MTGKTEASSKLLALDETEASGQVLSLDKLEPLLGAIANACHAQGSPATSMISEYGAGQFEVNLQHQGDAFTGDIREREPDWYF